MSTLGTIAPTRSWKDNVSLGARVVLGVLYLIMGVSKADDPVAFLKLVRQYEVVTAPLGLNLVSATLPWFEIYCGLLLLLGVAVRGAALVSLGMLLPFTALVWRHALSIQAATHVPFCAVRFDCGCGAGEIFICSKLLENGALMLLSLWLVVGGRSRWPVGREWPRPG